MEFIQNIENPNVQLRDEPIDTTGMPNDNEFLTRIDKLMGKVNVFLYTESMPADPETDMNKLYKI